MDNKITIERAVEVLNEKNYRRLTWRREILQNKWVDGFRASSESNNLNFVTALTNWEAAVIATALLRNEGPSEVTNGKQ